MPTIPRYQRTEQANTFQAPESRLNPRLDQIGQAAGQAAQSISRVAEVENRRRLELQSLEERNAFADFSLNYLRDPENGALNQQGKNAFGATERGMKALDEFVQTRKEAGVNDRVLAQLEANARRDMQSRLAMHEAQARKQYATDVTKTTIEQTKTSIAAYWNDDTEVAEQLGWGEAAIVAQGREAGLPAETIEASLAEYRSQAQTDRILVALDQDPILAKQLMDDVEGDLLPEDRLSLNGRLEPAVQAQNGEEIGRQIFQDYGMNPDRQAYAMDKLNEIEDRDERRYAKAMYRDLLGAEKQAQLESYNADLEGAWNMVLGGQHWTEIPKSQLARLKPSDRKQIMDWKPGGDTDWQTYEQLSEIYARDPRRFAEMDLSQALPKLGDTERKQVLGWRRDALSDDRAEANKRAWIDTKNNIIKAGLQGMKVETGAKATPEDIQKSNAFRGAVQRRYETWMSDHPDAEEMPEGEFRKMVNQMATEVALPGSGFAGFFQDRVRAYEAPAGAEVVVDAEDVPADQRRLIEDSLIRRGIPVTDDLIVRYYLQGTGLQVSEDD